jgi:hypothetical protein
MALYRRVSPENEKPAETAGVRQALPFQENLERAKGLEPSTPTLARLGILITFINDAERF